MNKYSSPTTPGLDVTLNNYLIELICLNMDPKLQPRFWKNSGPYWKGKYGREVKGVFNLLKNFESLEDALLQRTIIDTIRGLNIKCVLSKKTITKVVKAVNRDYIIRLRQREQMVLDTKPHQPISSSEFVDVGNETKLAKIKAIQNGKEAGC